MEASTTLRRRMIERQSLLNELNRHLREVKRMRGYAEGVENARDPMQALLLGALQNAIERFERIARRLQDSSVLRPLTGADIASALGLVTEYGLQNPDAFVLASILGNPDGEPVESCFLNRNTNDFDNPPIHALLARQSCKLLGNFQSGLQYIQARRGQPA
jgi:hypothetical protein